MIVLKNIHYINKCRDYKGFCSHHGTKVDDPVSFIPAELAERSSEIFKHLLSSMSEQFTHFAGLLNGEYASITAPTLLPDDNSYSILLYYRYRARYLCMCVILFIIYFENI